MAHSLISEPKGGIRRWYAIVGPIGIWMVHLIGLAALATSSCESDASRWSMHLLTLVTAVGTLLAMWWALGMVRAAGPIGEGEPTASGRERFLGLFGLGTGVISLVLIVWEGSYVLAINACRPLG